MATRTGLEPVFSGVTGRRDNQLHQRAIFQKSFATNLWALLTLACDSPRRRKKRVLCASSLVARHKVSTPTFMATLMGFDPTTSSVTGWRSPD